MEPCEQASRHDPHEHYGTPPVFRRECPGCWCGGPFPEAGCPSHGIVASLDDLFLGPRDDGKTPER